MGLLEDELKEVQQLCERVLDNTKLVTCVCQMVRVEMQFTPINAIILCIQFSHNYPADPLLLELKSKTLSDKLLKGLTTLCEKKMSESLGKPQVMKILKFVHLYLKENPLCCCYDEINNIKALLETNGSLKLKQKLCCINLEVLSGKYEVRMKISIPSEYPNKSIKIEEYTANFPEVFNLYLLGQCREIARRCVEPPLRKIKPKNGESIKPFQISPSLEVALKFVIETTFRFPKEECPVCNVQCLPNKPEDVIKDAKHFQHVERVMCGHLYHQGCLTTFLATPPFPKDGKLCIACPQKLQHDKWGVSTRLAEARWAHRQARERELEEVKDFLQ